MKLQLWFHTPIYQLADAERGEVFLTLQLCSPFPFPCTHGTFTNQHFYLLIQKKWGVLFCFFSCLAN